jgi:DNA-binding NarL/FixJ family response regulator
MHQALQPTFRSGTASVASDNHPFALLCAEDWQAIVDRLHLSPRELEVAQGFLDCLDERGVADRIGISEHTVHTIARRMYHKAGARSRCELVVRLFGAYLASNGRTNGS